MTLSRLSALLSIALWALALPLIGINLRYGFRYALLLVMIVALATLPQLAYPLKPEWPVFRWHALAVTAVGLGMLAIKVLAVGTVGEPRSEILSYVVIGLVIAIGLVSRSLVATHAGLDRSS